MYKIVKASKKDKGVAISWNNKDSQTSTLHLSSNFQLQSGDLVRNDSECIVAVLIHKP